MLRERVSDSIERLEGVMLAARIPVLFRLQRLIRAKIEVLVDRKSNNENANEAGHRRAHYPPAITMFSVWIKSWGNMNIIVDMHCFTVISSTSIVIEIFIGISFRLADRLQLGVITEAGAIFVWLIIFRNKVILFSSRFPFFLSLRVGRRLPVSDPAACLEVGEHIDE